MSGPIGNKNALGNHHKLSDKTKKKMSKSSKKRWKNPKEREKQSKRSIRYFEENPVSDKTKKKMSKAQKKYFEENPRSDKAGEKISIRQLKYIKNHPGPFKDTKPELKMKEIFSRLNVKFKHQVIIEGIRHVFDFVDEENKIIVEVDGRYFHTLPGKRQRDYKFNRLAKKLGYRVLRFWDDDVMKNEEKVIEKLKEI